MRFNEAKYQVLPLDRGSLRYVDRLGGLRAGEDFNVLVGERLNTRQQSKLPGQKANTTLGCIHRGVAGRKGKRLSPSALPS